MSLKAFELVPVVDKLNLGGEKSHSSISCLELSQENLYLGTNDCFVIHFAIKQENSLTGKATFVHKLQRHKHLGLRKPIKQMLAFASIGLLLVLCDGNVYGLAMLGLELRSEMNKEMFRGVTVMSRNCKPPVFNPEEVQVCFGTKRKSVQIYTLTATSSILLKEINLTDPPSVLAIDSQSVCTTLGKQYFIINYTTSAVQELFMYESQNVLPLVKRIGNQEFLLNGPTDTMGMIVTAEGLSMHQPLTWSDGLRSVAYSYPYLLVLGNSTVTVHNILDQKQKQAMSFHGGITLNDYDDIVLVAMEKSVMAFIPVPYDKQIQMLLIDKRVDEAFDLLLVATKSNPKEYNLQFENQVRTQAGFIYFAEGKFNMSLDLFIQSSVDPREVITLYPLMMPANRKFLPSRPLLHNIKDLTVVVKGSKSVFAEAKKFLLKYLEKCRHKYPECNVEVDTALMKLYVECNHPKLSELLSTSNECYIDETLSWLSQFKRYHSLALYYCFLCQSVKAMEVWRKLIGNEIEDPNFPGMSFVVKFLTNITEEKLIWNSLLWLLEKNQKMAVKIVTERSDNIAIDDLTCNYLQKFPIALQIYLEHLVYDKQLAKEKHHTHLAIIYADRVIQIMQDNLKVAAELDAARSKLKTMLETSSLYRVSTLLQKIAYLPLYDEIAILYGKMDQHEKALKILVYKSKDFVAAERYCDVISIGKDESFKQKVFYTLLETYLHPSSNEDETDMKVEHFIVPAVQLLNSRQAQFELSSVIKLLPDDWSVDMIKPFLSGSVRNSLSAVKHSMLESALSRQHFLSTKFISIYTKKGVVNMHEDKVCDFCKKVFSEPIGVRYPNGTLVHAHCCMDKNVCPVTGTKFY